MIEVNLLPGAARRKGRRKRSVGISLPKLGGLPAMDRMVLALIVGWIASPLAVAWLFFSARGEKAELEAAIQQAQTDSVRYAHIIASTEALQAQRDTIAQKLAIIQEIDAGRYVWPHILDEISRALPEYTWLTSITQTQGGFTPRFRIEGRTGNNIALTRFMKDLEASPFLRNIRLSSTQQIRDNDELVYAFMLEAEYTEAPPQFIETVPLFPEIE